MDDQRSRQVWVEYSDWLYRKPHRDTFCYSCGTELVTVVKKGTNFDRDTGERIDWKFKTCPKCYPGDLPKQSVSPPYPRSGSKRFLVRMRRLWRLTDEAEDRLLKALSVACGFTAIALFLAAFSIGSMWSFIGSGIFLAGYYATEYWTAMRTAKSIERDLNPRSR